MGETAHEPREPARPRGCPIHGGANIKDRTMAEPTSKTIGEYRRLALSHPGALLQKELLASLNEIERLRAVAAKMKLGLESYREALAEAGAKIRALRQGPVISA